MEKRLEPCVYCYQPAELRLLDADGYSLPGHVIHLDGKNLRIVVDRLVEVNQPASIRVGDWMGFGEVSYCQPEYSHYAIGLELDQVVIGLNELDALRRNRLREGIESRPPR